MPRFSAILCPVDFDANSIAALGVACELAQEHKGVLDILHVVPIPLGPEVLIPFDELEGKAKSRLERLVRRKVNPNLRCTVHVRSGDLAGEVIRVARETGADLIVMATHGRTGLSRFVLGSVAERVVRESPCPVLTIKPKARGRSAGSSRARASRRRGA